MSDRNGGTPDWDRVREVFHGAVEQEGAERLQYLSVACAGDAALRSEVESLLTHTTGGLLGEPAESPAEPGLTGTAFGDYRILKPLGQGGMGTVYLAERVGAGFTQRVALKLLRRELFHSLGGTPALDHRFARERQILARLEHPGIARLIDGGYGPGGQPYLAMEYVEGDSLTDFARKQELDIESRVRLFIAVAEAVHYAHQRLVIHRDLKPGNILIQASGDPKLLDFGVATLAASEDQDGSEDTTTRAGFWFTPGYASPEQVRGGRVTTLSDIYSLGVLLYELLAGRRPYDLVELSPRAIEEVVCGRVPERPSSRVDNPQLARRLRGDLDTIVLKALAKEPERRYRSAQGLAEDLRRHLEHEPVKARPDTLAYRMRTFARRNRAAVTGAALALLALTAGLITTSWQARKAAAARLRAETALARSQEVTDFLVGLFQESDPNVSAVNAAFAAALLERGKARVDELRDQPAVQARLLDALGQLFLNMGRYAEAREAIERGLTIRRATFGEEHPDVAASLQHLGRIERVEGRYQAAEQLYLQALAILRRTTGTEHAAYADALSDFAFLLPYLVRTAEAESAYREVVAIRRRVLKPADPLIGDAIIRVSAALQAQGKFAAAESAARVALTLRREAMGPFHPRVGVSLINIADVIWRDSTRWAEAESLYREGVALQRRTMGDQYLGLAHGLGNLASLLRRQRRYAEAESLLRNVLQLRVAGLGPDHSSVAFDRGALADLWADLGRLDEAINLRKEVAATIERVQGPDHSMVAGGLYSLALLYLRKPDLAAADSLLKRSVEIGRRAHGPMHLQVGRAQAELGEIAVRRRQYEPAEGLLLQALAVFKANRSATPEEIARARRNLATTYRALGRPADATRYATADST